LGAWLAFHSAPRRSFRLASAAPPFGGTVAATDVTDEKLKLAQERAADIEIGTRNEDPAVVV